MDLLNRMAKEIGFSYEIYEYEDYGSFLPDENGTKRWTGLVGAVERGDADFAVSAMTVTPQRYYIKSGLIKNKLEGRKSLTLQSDTWIMRLEF